ncbi:hypothetical protein FHETE_8644 [Fusarium heterosporum]|uniref:Involucrin repeat protein n=1 Tax=Fusarium heterosporum TaxID=42747 RepID=A0A8H5WK62_FUSHE|nr:hypothetical protein FHETE_8644 [Fusarium heterosporum]
MQRDNRSRDPEGSRRRWYESRDRDPRDQGDSRQQPQSLPPQQPQQYPQQQQPFSPVYQQTPPPRQYDSRYDQSPMYQQSPQYPRFPAPPQQYQHQQPHPYSAQHQPMPAYNDPRQSQQTPQRPQTPSSVFSSSSDTSTSLLDISRFKDTKQFGGVFGTFFKAPSERVKQRLHRKKPKKRRVLYFGNSSSSSVNSDLAYGNGYVKQPKSRTLSPRSQSRASGQGQGSVSGQFPTNGHRRRSSGGSDRTPRLPPRKKTADEEIMALGQQLSDLARRSKEDEQRISRRSSGKGKAAALGLAAGAAGVAMTSRLGKEKKSPKGKGKGKGKSKHRVDTSDDGSDWEDWEDASDGESSSSDDAGSAADSELAYGTVGESIKPIVGVATAAGSAAAGAAMANSRRTSGHSQSSEYRRYDDRGSIVDPRLFGPYNSLRGSINTPCGFRDERQAEVYRRDSANFEFGSPIQMRDLHSDPTSAHNRVDSGQFSASGYNRVGSGQFSASSHNRFGSGQFSASGPHQDSSPRPAPVPLQQPVPKLPVSSKVYETEKLDNVNGKDSRQNRREPADARTWSGVAAAGLAAAAAGAAIASSSRKDPRESRDEKKYDRDDRDRREQERIDMERQKALEVEQQKLNELERQKARELERFKNQDPRHKYSNWEEWHKALEHERERNAKWERDYRELEPEAVIPNYNNDRKSSRYNDHDDTPKERNEKKEKQNYDVVVAPRQDQSKGEPFRIEHGQQFKVTSEPVVQAESGQRKDTRDGRVLPLPTGAGHQAMTEPTQSEPEFVDPFQYQVADDAFTLSQRTTPGRPLTPNVVTIEREPNFDDSPPRNSADDARLSRRDSFEIERMVEEYQRESQNAPQQQRSQTRNEYQEEERQAKSILDEAKIATVPVAAAAVASAIAVEHNRAQDSRKEKSSKSKSSKGKSSKGDSSKSNTQSSSRGRKDVVQEEADRYYRESNIARKIASEELRSRSASPERSVVDKWQDDKNESFTIVTPPAMEDHHSEKNAYEAPNADVKIDNKIHPQEERRFRNTGGNSSALVLRPRDASRERPVLNLIYPTPAASRQPTPAPEARKTRQVPEESFTSEDVVIGPKGEVLPSSEPASVAKSVSWGENETKRFNAHTPENQDESNNYFPNDKSPEKPRPKLNKASRWGILAAALAGSSAEPHNEPDVELPYTRSDMPGGFSDDTSRDIAVQRAEVYGDDASREPPVPGPKPTSPHHEQMPGGYADDLEFAATLAAGLKDTGFNPDIVIEDPSYSRRDSPPGVQEANGDSHRGANGNAWYKRPYVDAVPEAIDVNAPKLLPEQGFVLGEVETPQEKTPASYQGQRDINSGLPKPEDVPLPDNGPDNSKLSKREQRKRDKSDVVVVQDDGKIENARAEPSSSREEAEEVWEDITRKKGKKKGRKSRDWEADSSPSVSTPLDYNTGSTRDMPARDATSNQGWSTPRDEERSRDFSAADIATVALPALALGALASSGSRDAAPRDVHSDDERDASAKSRKPLKDDDYYYGNDRSDVSAPVKPSHHRHSSRDASSRDVRPDDELDESKHSRKHRKDRDSRDEDRYRDYAALDPVDRRSSRREASRDRSRDRSRHHSRDRSRDRSRHRSKSHRSRDRTRERSRDRSRHRKSDDEEERPKRSKRHSYGYDSPTRSFAASEVSLASTSSRRSKKSKRRSGNEDDLADSKDTPSDRTRDLFDDRDVSSVMSESRGDDRRREGGHRRKSSRYDDDDARSVASSPGSSRRDKEPKERKTPEKRASNSVLSSLFKPRKDKKDSFLGNADTLGAGVGLASAAAIYASDATRSNAADAPSDQEHYTSRDGHRRARSYELVDPEVVSRVIKPAIDPQYGDLLPLPPSEPSSPISGPEDLPPLPDSRPDTPPQERIMRRDMWSHQRRRSAFETPTKSPSRTAVPIALRLGNRSNPGSPISYKVSPASSPIVPHSDAVVMSRRAARPTSWDSTREIMPLYLLEHARQQPTTGSVLPALPPSEPSESSARNSPESEFLKHNDDYFGNELDFVGPDLRVDTQLSEQHRKDSDAESQETTPRAEYMPVLPAPEPSEAANESMEEIDNTLPLPVDSTSKDMDRDLYSPTPSPVDTAAMAIPAALAAAAYIRGREDTDSPAERTDDATSVDEHFSDASEGHSEPSSPGAYVFRTLASRFDDRPQRRVESHYERIPEPIAAPTEEHVVEKSPVEETPVSSVTELLGLPTEGPSAEDSPVVEKSPAEATPVNSVTELLGLPTQEPVAEKSPIVEKSPVEATPVNSVTEILGLPTRELTTEESTAKEPTFYPSTEPVTEPVVEPAPESVVISAQESAFEESLMEDSPVNSVTQLLGLPAGETVVERPTIEEPVDERSLIVKESPAERSTVDSVTELLGLAIEDAVVVDSAAEEPTVDKSVAKESPIVQKSPAERPPIESVTEPLGLPVEEPTAEEPATEERTIKQYDTKEPAFEEPAVERSLAQMPPAESSPIDSVTKSLGLPVKKPAAEESPAQKSFAQETSANFVTEPLDLPVEEPVDEERIIEEPATEEPAPEEPAVDESSAQKSLPEAPLMNSVTELLGLPAEEPTVERSAAETPAVEHTLEKPSVRSLTEPFGISVEQPTIEKSIAEEPAYEHGTEELTTKEPTIEEPIVQESIVEIHAQEEHNTDKSTAEEPTIQEPVAAGPAVKTTPVKSVTELLGFSAEEPKIEKLTVEESTIEDPTTTYRTKSTDSAAQYNPQSFNDSVPDGKFDDIDPLNQTLETDALGPSAKESTRDPRTGSTDGVVVMPVVDSSLHSTEAPAIDTMTKTTPEVVRPSDELEAEAPTELPSAPRENKELNSMPLTVPFEGDTAAVEPDVETMPESAAENTRDHDSQLDTILAPAVPEATVEPSLEPVTEAALEPAPEAVEAAEAKPQDPISHREENEITTEEWENMSAKDRKNMKKKLKKKGLEPIIKDSFDIPILPQGSSKGIEIAQNQDVSAEDQLAESKPSAIEAEGPAEPASKPAPESLIEGAVDPKTISFEKPAVSQEEQLPSIELEKPSEPVGEVMPARPEQSVRKDTESKEEVPEAVDTPALAVSEHDRALPSIEREIASENISNAPSTIAEQALEEIPESPSKSKKKKKKSKTVQQAEEKPSDVVPEMPEADAAPAAVPEADKSAFDAWVEPDVIVETPTEFPKASAEDGSDSVTKPLTDAPAKPAVDAEAFDAWTQPDATVEVVDIPEQTQDKSVPAPEPTPEVPLEPTQDEVVSPSKSKKKKKKKKDNKADDEPAADNTETSRLEESLPISLVQEQLSSANEIKTEPANIEVPKPIVSPKKDRGKPLAPIVAPEPDDVVTRDDGGIDDSPPSSPRPSTQDGRKDSPSQRYFPSALRALPSTAGISAFKRMWGFQDQSKAENKPRQVKAETAKPETVTAAKPEVVDAKPDVPAANLGRESIISKKSDVVSAEKLKTIDAKPDTPATDLHQATPVGDAATPAFESYVSEPLFSQDSAPIEESQTEASQVDEPRNFSSDKPRHGTSEDQVEATDRQPVELNQDDAANEPKPILEQVAHEKLLETVVDDNSKPTEKQVINTVSEETLKPLEFKPDQDVVGTPIMAEDDSVTVPAESKLDDTTKNLEVEPVQALEEPVITTEDDVVKQTENTEADASSSKKKAKKNKKKKKGQDSQNDTIEDQLKDSTKQDEIPQQPQVDKLTLVSDIPITKTPVLEDQTTLDHVEQLKPEDKLQTRDNAVEAETKGLPTIIGQSGDESVIHKQSNIDEVKEQPPLTDEPAVESELTEQPQSNIHSVQPKIKEQSHTEEIKDQLTVDDKPANEPELRGQSQNDDKPAEPVTEDQPQTDEAQDRSEIGYEPVDESKFKEQSQADDKPLVPEVKDQLKTEETKEQPHIDEIQDQSKTDDKPLGEPEVRKELHTDEKSLEPETMDQSQTGDKPVKESVQVSENLANNSPADEGLPSEDLDAEKIAEEKAAREAEDAEAAKEKAEIDTLLSKREKRKGRLLKKDQARLTLLEENATKRAEDRATREAEKKASEEAVEIPIADTPVQGPSEAEIVLKPVESQDKDAPLVVEETAAEKTSDADVIPPVEVSNAGEAEEARQSTEGQVDLTPLPVVKPAEDSHVTVDTIQSAELQEAPVVDEILEPGSKKSKKKKKRKSVSFVENGEAQDATMDNGEPSIPVPEPQLPDQSNTNMEETSAKEEASSHGSVVKETATDMPLTDAKQTEDQLLANSEEPVAEDTPAEPPPEGAVDAISNDGESEAPSEKKSKKKKKKKKNASSSDEPEFQPEVEILQQETPDSKKDIVEDVKDAAAEETSPNASNTLESAGVDSTEASFPKDEASLSPQPETINTSHDPVLANDAQAQPADVKIPVETPLPQEPAQDVAADKADTTTPDQPPAEDSLIVEDSNATAKLSKKDKKKKKKAEKKKADLEGTQDPESGLATPSQNVEAPPQPEAIDIPTEDSKDTPNETLKQIDSDKIPDTDSNLEGKLAAPASDAKVPDTGDSGKLPSEEPAGPKDERGGFSLRQSQTDQENKAKDNDFEILQDPETKHLSEPKTKPSPEPEKEDADVAAMDEAKSHGSSKGDKSEEDKSMAGDLEVPVKPETNLEPGSELVEEKLEDNTEFAGLSKKQIKKLKKAKALAALESAAEPSTPKEAGTSHEETLESAAEAGLEDGSKPEMRCEPAVSETPARAVEELGPETDAGALPMSEEIVPIDEPDFEAESKSKPDTQPPDSPITQPATEPAVVEPKDAADVPTLRIEPQETASDQDNIVPAPEVKSEEPHAHKQRSITNIAVDQEALKEERTNSQKQPPQESIEVIEAPVFVPQMDTAHETTSDTNMTETHSKGPSSLHVNEDAKETAADRSGALENPEQARPSTPAIRIHTPEVPADTSVETEEKDIPPQLAEGPDELFTHLPESSDRLVAQLESDHPLQSTSDHIAHETLDSSPDTAEAIERPDISGDAFIPQPEIILGSEPVESPNVLGRSVDEAIAGLSDAEQNKLDEEKEVSSEDVKPPVDTESTVDSAIMDDAKLPADWSATLPKQEAPAEDSLSPPTSTEIKQDNAHELIANRGEEETTRSLADKTIEPEPKAERRTSLSESVFEVAIPTNDLPIADGKDGQNIESFNQVNEEKGVEESSTMTAKVPETPEMTKDSALPQLDDIELSHTPDSAAPVQPAASSVLTSTAETKPSTTPAHERAENEFTTQEWHNLSSKDKKSIKRKLKKKDLDLIIADSFKPETSTPKDLIQTAPEAVSQVTRTDTEVTRETPERDEHIDDVQKPSETEPFVEPDLSTSNAGNAVIDVQQNPDPNDWPEVPIEHPVEAVDDQERVSHSDIAFGPEKQNTSNIDNDASVGDKNDQETDTAWNVEDKSSAPSETLTMIDLQPAEELHSKSPRDLPPEPVTEPSDASETNTRSTIDVTPARISEEVQQTQAAPKALEVSAEVPLQPPTEAPSKESKDKKGRKSSLHMIDTPVISAEVTDSAKDDSRFPSRDHVSEHQANSGSKDDQDTVTPSAPIAELLPSTEYLSPATSEQPAPDILAQEPPQQEALPDSNDAENTNGPLETATEDKETDVGQAAVPAVEKVKDNVYAEILPALKDAESSEPTKSHQEVTDEVVEPPHPIDTARQIQGDSTFGRQPEADNESRFGTEQVLKDTKTVQEDDKEGKKGLSTINEERTGSKQDPVAKELSNEQNSAGDTSLAPVGWQTQTEPATAEAGTNSSEKQSADDVKIPELQEDENRKPASRDPHGQGYSVESIKAPETSVEASVEPIQAETAVQVEDTPSLPPSPKDKKKKKKRKSKTADAPVAEPTESTKSTSQLDTEPPQHSDDRAIPSPDGTAVEQSAQVTAPVSVNVPDFPKEVEQTRSLVTGAKEEGIQDHHDRSLDNSKAIKENNLIEDVTMTPHATVAEETTPDITRDNPPATNGPFVSEAKGSRPVADAEEIPVNDKPSSQSSEPLPGVAEASATIAKPTKKDKKNRKKKHRQVDDDNIDTSKESQGGVRPNLPEITQLVERDFSSEQLTDVAKPVPDGSGLDSPVPTLGEPGTSLQTADNAVEGVNTKIAIEEPKTAGKELEVTDREASRQNKDNLPSGAGHVDKAHVPEQTRPVAEETQAGQNPLPPMAAGRETQEPEIQTPEPQLSKDTDVTDRTGAVSSVPSAGEETHRSDDNRAPASKDVQPEQPVRSVPDPTPQADRRDTRDTDVPPPANDVSVVDETLSKTANAKSAATSAPRHLPSSDNNVNKMPKLTETASPVVGVLDKVASQKTTNKGMTSQDTPTPPSSQPLLTGQTTAEPLDSISNPKMSKKERKARKLAKEKESTGIAIGEKSAVSDVKDTLPLQDTEKAQSEHQGNLVSTTQDDARTAPTTPARKDPAEVPEDNHARDAAIEEPRKGKKPKREPGASIPGPVNEPDVPSVARPMQLEATPLKDTDTETKQPQTISVPAETSTKLEGQPHKPTGPEPSATNRLPKDKSLPKVTSDVPAIEGNAAQVPESVVNTPSSEEETKTSPTSSKPSRSIFAGFTAATAAWGTALFGDKKDAPPAKEKKQDEVKVTEDKNRLREGQGGKSQTGEQNATTMSSHGIQPTVKDTGKDSRKDSPSPRETQEVETKSMDGNPPISSSDRKDKSKGIASDPKDDAKVTNNKGSLKKVKEVVSSGDDAVLDESRKREDTETKSLEKKDADKKDKEPGVTTAVKDSPARLDKVRKETSRKPQPESLHEAESPILGRGDLELSREFSQPLLRRDSGVEEPKGGLLREDSQTYTPLTGTESDISDLRRSPSRLLEPVPEVPEAEAEPTKAAFSTPKAVRGSGPIGDASSFQRRSRRLSEETQRDSGLRGERNTLRRSRPFSPEPLRDSGVHTEDWIENERRSQSAIDRAVLHTPDSSERRLRRSPRGTPVLREPVAPEPTSEPVKKKQYGPLTPAGPAAAAVTASAGLAGALRAGRSASSSPSTPTPHSRPNSNPTSSVAGRRSASDNASPTRRSTPGLEAARRTISNTSLSRRRTPEPLRLRPESPGINRASGTPTPPLRRADRRMSSDLRTIRQQNTAAAPANSTPVANEGRARAKDMADVYDGFGEGRIGSPRSPTRPHSMRRRQSMQVLELENRVELLMAENRMLAEARAVAESSISQRAANSLSERDVEIDKLKQSLQFLQNEVSRLTEVNDGLASANVELANKDTGRVADLESRNATVARELEETRRAKGTSEQSLEAKDAEIAELRAELNSAKEKIRDLQRQILESKANDAHFLNIRDEDHFDHRCQQLCSHVQQWVLRFSKFSDMRACRLTSEINDEKTIDRLDNAVLDGSDVDVYLRDRVKRRDIFMSMTMNMIWEFVFTRYLFGMDREQRQKLKSLEKLLTEVGPPEAVRQWRAVTLTLLAKRESFKRQRDLDTEAVVQAIFQTLCKILPPPSNLEDQIQSQLRRVMREAVGLSIEMRTQKAEYMMLPPLAPEYDADGELTTTLQFNASMMNERSGSITTSNEDLEAQGAIVRTVLFPLVVKKGDDNGKGDEEIVVCPAQVLVPRSKHLFGVASDGGSTSIGARSHISVVTETLGQTEVDYLDGGS